MFLYELFGGGDVRHELFEIMQQTMLSTKRLYGKRLEPYGLTYAQYQVLTVIAEHEGLTAKDLLVYIDSDKATLSGVLKRLEANHLIKRLRDDVDRRKQRIHCETAAVEMIAQFNKESDRLEKTLLKGLRGRELRLCRDVLRHIESRVLEKINEPTEQQRKTMVK